MRTVSLREFYQGGCKNPLRGLSKESSRYSIMAQITRRLCDGLVAGTSKENLMKEAEEILSCEYLQDKLFDYDWQSSLYKKDDLQLIERFLDWIGPDTRFIASDMPLTVKVSQNTAVSLHIDLLVQYPNGVMAALIIKQGKASKSPKGKSVHTNINTDLFCMAAKLGLENEYPGILVSMVYMKNESDSDGNIADFHVDSTKKSNVFTLSYPSFYDEGGFQKEEFSSLMLSVMNTKIEPDCFNCLDKAICKKRKVNVTAKKQEVHPPYVMPQFTASQNKVVNHLDGPMLVCAGPGSGKTATIVGRIKHLIDAGIEHDFILAITFTNKAAEELRQRCSSFCNPGEMPEISTLHALGYSILRKNEARIGKVRLLTRMEQMKIISSLLEETPRLQNFSYTTRERLLQKVANKLDAYKKYPDTSLFMEKEQVKEDFVAFAKRYFRILNVHGYITFDDQIAMCLTLFREYPEVPEILQKRYQYIMVDEYQDIDSEQADFIYSIAKNGNIVAVGDDDQSIYGFRGGSNQYMLDFPKVFHNAETVVLQENFRSTQTLVDAAQKVIGINRKRIPKHILAMRACALEPQILTGGTRELEKIVDFCIKKGYAYSDIAILSSKNTTLEQFSGEVGFPHFLEKNFLTEDRFFHVVRDILSLYYNGTKDLFFLSLSVSFGIPVKTGDGYAKRLSEGYPDVLRGDRVPSGDDPVLNMYRCLEMAFSLLRTGIKASSFLDALSVYLGIEDTASAEAVEQILVKNHIHTCSDLLDVMNYMVYFQDDTRIEADRGNSVEMTTSHDAKGREYPVVVMLDDYRMEGEESTRLYYVAMTRAKDMLFILKKNNATLLEQIDGKKEV